MSTTKEVGAQKGSQGEFQENQDEQKFNKERHWERDKQYRLFFW